MFVKGKYRAPEFWFDRDGDEFPPEVNYYVGGNTKFYGAALFRLRPEDFGEIRHHGGLSPAWPIGYDDLEPYYTQAEHLYQVHGRHGEDPTEGRRARTTPTRRCSTSRGSSSSATTWRSRACTRSTCRSGSTSPRTSTAGHARQRLHPLRPGGRLPVPGRRKSDAQVICVDPALAHENVQMITDAHVHRLETDPSGRTVTAVVTERRRRQTVAFSADVVVVAAGAVNSAVLLLRSANDPHPDGLANSSDVVGRHYMRHNNLALMAVSKEPNPTLFQKTLALNDWYLGSDDWDYPLGGIQMLGKSDAEQVRANAPDWAGAIARRCRSRCSPTTRSTSGCAARTCPRRRTA